MEEDSTGLPREILQALPHPDKFGALLGYEFLMYDDLKAQSRTRLKIEEKHLSPSGAVHGGVISAFVDWTMGTVLFHRVSLKDGEALSTIEFKINYLAPVQLGETIMGEARCSFYGRSHAVLQFRVFREMGQDVAMGTGTYNLYRASQACADPLPE